LAVDEGKPQLFKSTATITWLPFVQALLLLPGAHGGIMHGPQAQVQFGLQFIINVAEFCQK